MSEIGNITLAGCEGNTCKVDLSGRAWGDGLHSGTNNVWLGGTYEYWNISTRTGGLRNVGECSTSGTGALNCSGSATIQTDVFINGCQRIWLTAGFTSNTVPVEGDSLQSANAYWPADLCRTDATSFELREVTFAPPPPARLDETVPIAANQYYALRFNFSENATDTIIDIAFTNSASDAAGNERTDVTQDTFVVVDGQPYWSLLSAGGGAFIAGTGSAEVGAQGTTLRPEIDLGAVIPVTGGGMTSFEHYEGKYYAHYNSLTFVGVTLGAPATLSMRADWISGIRSMDLVVGNATAKTKNMMAEGVHAGAAAPLGVGAGAGALLHDELHPTHDFLGSWLGNATFTGTGTTSAKCTKDGADCAGVVDGANFLTSSNATDYAFNIAFDARVENPYWTIVGVELPDSSYW